MAHQQQQRQQLYQQSPFKELKKVVPGFLTDREHPWAVYLPPQDQSWLSTKKQHFLSTLEDFDNAKVVKERKQLSKDLIEFIDEVLPKCKQLKEKAALIEKKRFTYNPDTGKKRRLDNEMDVDGCDDHEEDDDYYSPDDYMPNLKPKEKQKNVEKAKQQEEEIIDNNQEVGMMWTPFAGTSSILFPAPTSTKNIPTPTNPVQDTSTRTPQEDWLIRDINDHLTKDILIDLRTLIQKYDCRDRVLRTIKGLKSEKSNKDAIKVFDHLLKEKAKQCYM